MSFSASLSSDQVLEVFREELADQQGQVTDVYHAGERLLARAILPRALEVRPRDKMQGGVALKLTSGELWLYPYLFRLVCRNGAIIAETLDAKFLGDITLHEPAEATAIIREGIAACCEPEVFDETLDRVRATCHSSVDLALNLMPLISQLMQHGGTELLTQIMERFTAEGDDSQFGFANAVTSLARDTRDPVLRWDLEETGGGILIGAPAPTEPLVPVH